MAAIINRLRSARSLLNWLKTVDGSGSGLDADTLDGLEGAAYAVLANANTFTNNQTLSASGANDRYLTLNADAGRTRGVLLRASNVLRWIAGSDPSDNFVVYRYNSSGVFQGTAFSLDGSTGACNIAGTINSTSGGFFEGGQQIGLTGTWTPTLTGVTNISSTESFQCSYVRIKDYVMFDGLFRAAKTATGAVAGTSLGISLPIASNFTNALDAHGVFMTNGQTEGGSIESDATNDRLSAVWTANVTTNRFYRFTGGYFIK